MKKSRFFVNQTEHFLRRTVERSENPEVPVLFGGHNLPPLVEIGLTDLPKSVGAMDDPLALLKVAFFRK